MKSKFNENSSNQTLIPSYSAEIAENERPVKHSPLLLNKKIFSSLSGKNA